MSISGATAAAAVANTASATVVSAAAAAATAAITAATATNVYTQFMPCCHYIQQDTRTTFDRAIKIAYKYI